jgi:hypothetical protein
MIFSQAALVIGGRYLAGEAAILAGEGLFSEFPNLIYSPNTFALINGIKTAIGLYGIGSGVLTLGSMGYHAMMGEDMSGEMNDFLLNMSAGNGLPVSENKFSDLTPEELAKLKDNVDLAPIVVF